MSSNSKYHVEALTQADVPGGACCVAETTFATLFPAYLEKYIVSIWPAAEAVLKQHQLTGKLDAIEGSMAVSTTRQTWDPFAVVNARDFIKLLARNVPVAQAARIFEDGMTCDIIRIGVNVKNTKRFVKRRDRLIGPQGQTLKALEILTKCYVLVQGKTVAVMGPHKGCEEVRKVVEGCMRNIHPVYRLKQLLVRRELSKREDMKGQDWSRFIPQYKKSTPNKDKIKAIAKKKKERLRESAAKETAKLKKSGGEKSVFPPMPTKRKEDIAMESGEHWLGANKTLDRNGRLQRKKKKEKADEDAAASKTWQE